MFLESLERTRLPKNAEHGDFFVGNILISNDGQVYVTDWEFYEDEGEPLFDFVFFVLANCTRGANISSSLRDNFFGKGTYSFILKALVSQFTQAKGLSPELVVQAVPYAILRCLHRAAPSADNKHLDVVSYINLLECWDKACLSANAP